MPLVPFGAISLSVNIALTEIRDAFYITDIDYRVNRTAALVYRDVTIIRGNDRPLKSYK